MPYFFGDVLLVPLPFSDGTDVKRRPILVVFDAGDADLLVVPITSHAARSAEDARLEEWQAAGLRLPSAARMAKFATVAKTTVLRRLGRLSESDRAQARQRLRSFFERLSDFADRRPNG